MISRKTLSLQGCITPPSSKSQSIRALIIALLTQGQSDIYNFLEAEDTCNALQACKELGANIREHNNFIRVNSNGLPFTPISNQLYTGNSGITTLFTLPLLGLRENFASPMYFNCGQQMQTRPVQPLIDALNTLGMKIKPAQTDSYFPLRVEGQLKGGIVEIDGLNSQYLSALLISLPCAKNDSLITVKNLHEKPYVEMTLIFLNLHRIQFTQTTNGNIDTFHIPGNQHYTPQQYCINGDFSSASCLIAAAALIPSQVTFNGLNLQDCQGDKALISLLQSMGADISVIDGKIRVNKKTELKGLQIDAGDIPDLVPALAVIGTQAQGKTEIYNVAQARIKETDRLHAIAEGLKKMGARIEEHDAGLTIYPSTLHGAVVKGYNDHRTVMALAIAGLLAEGETIISDSQALNKTYPLFVETLQKMGANINLMHKPQVILIGFKYVGKTQIGQRLANALNKKFVDLDLEIEKTYKEKNFNSLTCRQIMQSHGEKYFRMLETQILKDILQQETCVIALGGGTLTTSINATLLSSHTLLHITAPRDIVFKRIMVEGRPAFFDSHIDAIDAFNQLWEQRWKVFKNLTNLTVNNDSSLDQAVHDALLQLH